jgi:hypothetical protein
MRSVLGEHMRKYSHWSSAGCEDMGPADRAPHPVPRLLTLVYRRFLRACTRGQALTHPHAPPQVRGVLMGVMLDLAGLGLCGKSSVLELFNFTVHRIRCSMLSSLTELKVGRAPLT